MRVDEGGNGKYRGKLISIGGRDRAGVEALAGQLVCWLQMRGVQLVRFSLPTRGPVGSLIRLQAQSRLRLDSVSLALLWTADRLDLLSREGGILEQLEAGMTVLCTHYAWWETGHCEDRDAAEASTYDRGQIVGSANRLGDCCGAKGTHVLGSKAPPGRTRGPHLHWRAAPGSKEHLGTTGWWAPSFLGESVPAPCRDGLLEMTFDPGWLERIHARCLRPDLALCVDGEASWDLWQQEVAALLWPGEAGV